MSLEQVLVDGTVWSQYKHSWIQAVHYNNTMLSICLTDLKQIIDASTSPPPTPSVLGETGTVVSNCTARARPDQQYSHDEAPRSPLSVSGTTIMIWRELLIFQDQATKARRAKLSSENHGVSAIVLSTSRALPHVIRLNWHCGDPIHFQRAPPKSKMPTMVTLKISVPTVRAFAWVSLGKGTDIMQHCS